MQIYTGKIDEPWIGKRSSNNEFHRAMIYQTISNNARLENRTYVYIWNIFSKLIKTR